jgi:hypothetical protein
MRDAAASIVPHRLRRARRAETRMSNALALAHHQSVTLAGRGGDDPVLLALQTGGTPLA